MKGIRRKLFPVIIVLIIIIISCYAAAVYHFEYQSRFESEVTTLSGALKEVSQNLPIKADMEEELLSTTIQRNFVRMQMIMENILHMSSKDLESAKEDLGDSTVSDIDFYRLDEHFNVIEQAGHSPLTLSQSELSQLIRQGTLGNRQRSYVASPFNSGYEVIACDTDTEFIFQLDYDLTKLVPYYVWNQKTGEVIASSHNLREKHLQSPLLSDIRKGETLTTVGDIDIRRVVHQGEKYLTATKNLPVNNKDMTICVLTTDGTYQQKAFYCTVYSTILLVLFTGSCIFMLYRLKRHWFIKNEEKRNPYRYSVQKAATVVTLCFVLVSLLLFNFQHILLISDEINDAFTNLSLLHESYIQNQKTVYDSTIQAEIACLDDIAGALYYDMGIDIEEWLKKKAELIQAEEIILYDKDGISVFSTDYLTGYSLSQCETDPEYQLWQLLNGSAKQLVFYSEEEHCTYMASRRYDAPGILVIKTKGQGISTILNSTILDEIEFANIFKLQDYPNADKFYYKRDNAETLYVLESGKAIAKTIANSLPTIESGQEIIGMRSIYGKNYLYIDSGSTDWVTIFAYPVAELAESTLKYTLLSAAAYILIILLLPLAIPGTAWTDAAEKNKGADLNTETKGVCSAIISALTITAALILASRTILFPNSIPLSQFFESWETGFNAISLIFITLSLSICIGIIILIGIVNALICRALPPKGITICTLLSNLIKVILAAAFLVITMEQLGINAMTITASLGLTGLALGFGSQAVISDLVSGLFIAFEGQLQLGDLVEINGFTGIIHSMGIRTTTLRYHNQEMTVNNTDIKNVINHSRDTLEPIKIKVIFPFDTDINHLKKIIQDAEPRFFETCKGKLKKSFSLDGVSDYKTYGIECTFKGYSAPLDFKKCRVRLQTELLNVLQENGIHPSSCTVIAKEES